MPQFVIKCEMPGAGKLSSAELKGASQNSCSVLRDLGPEIQWVHSYVADDKIYCISRAERGSHSQARRNRGPPGQQHCPGALDDRSDHLGVTQRSDHAAISLPAGSMK
jgi:hypothetical protein